ncbi:MAG: DHH family phosphoesterase [Spirosomataceae bacterium]
MQEFFTDSVQKLQDFEEFMSTPKKIVITTHQNPDADALGSALGMWGYLNKKGHFPTVITPTDYPDFLRWMDGEPTVINFEGSRQAEAIKLIAEADGIFCLDFSVLNRVKSMEEYVKQSAAKVLLIDHHQRPEGFADFVYWNEHAAATCELIYQFIEKLNDTQLVDVSIAECLYAGLMTDTGSFRFDSTSKEVHRIAGELINKGIEVNRLHRKIFDSNSFERMQFLGYCLSKMHYLPEYRVAYFAISKEELEQFHSRNGDTEGIVNYGLSIKDVVMSAIFVEREDLIKISFRSIEDFSVSELSRDHFDGGGHKNAAGGRSNQSLKDTVDKFLGLLPTYKDKLLAN